jgi:hypothetical protein
VLHQLPLLLLELSQLPLQLCALWLGESHHYVLLAAWHIPDVAILLLPLHALSRNVTHALAVDWLCVGSILAVGHVPSLRCCRRCCQRCHC